MSTYKVNYTLEIGQETSVEIGNSRNVSYVKQVSGVLNTAEKDVAPLVSHRPSVVHLDVFVRTIYALKTHETIKVQCERTLAKIR